ncbi:glycoside hydrolase family protein [Venturia nashicola]|nr:glycoside hydrolase family protein [Venturia nashicola]
MAYKRVNQEVELEGPYRDEDASTLRPSLEAGFASSDESEFEDIEEHDPLNYDAGTLKKKKQRKSRSNLEDSDGYHLGPESKRRSWARRHLVPTKFCSWMVALFFATVLGLLSAGGIWAVKIAPEDGQSPAWYPSPLGGANKEWESAYRKAALLVKKMTLVEKVNMTTGTGWSMDMCVGNTGPVPRLGFPSLCLQDGPLGLRFADNATAWPAGVTVGATWNKDLMYKRGQAHGLEARLKGVNVILGPSMGPIGRTPLGGRVWEGFGSDPVLQGIAAAETIRGIQSQNVIATAKHFVGNEQEHFRQAWAWKRPNAISSNIDDRTLHELYAWPFAESIRAGVGSIMCSYNQVNNSYACQNSKLMNGVLKDELGFQGFIQSDWLAQRGGVASALAGLDVSMPGDGLQWQDGNSLWGGQLTKSVLNGSVPIERLNDMVTRIAAAWYQLGQDNRTLYNGDGPNFSSFTNEEIGLLHPASDDKATGIVNKFINVQGEGKEAHGILARKIAAEGTVVVKNEDNILPLSKTGHKKEETKDRKFRVAVIGEDARNNKDGINACVDRSCNTGTLASGWGSGAVDFPYLVSPVEALNATYDLTKVQIGFSGSTRTSKAMEKLASDADMCMVFVNADAGEGYLAFEGIKGDRNDLLLQHNGEKLVIETAKHCGNNGTGDVVVVIHSVGPVLVEKFADLPNVKAIVFAMLPGQESGNALVDVLFGDLNPSGRLPYTVGKSLKDYGPSAPILTSSKGLVPQQNFSEGLLIDYRHFDHYNITPRYPFGFGLSYTEFQLSSGQIRWLSIAEKFKMLPKNRTDDNVAPPTYETKIPSPSSALFPNGFRKLRKYIYPYIDSIKGIGQGPPQYPPGFSTDQPSPPSPAGGGQGGNPDLYTTLIEVKGTLTNKGPLPGQAVVQVYVNIPSPYFDAETGETIISPKRVLRNWEKLFIEKTNGRHEFKIPLTRKDLSYWSPVRQNWVLPQRRKDKDGNPMKDITIEVGFSSRDPKAIRMTP